MVLVQGQCGVSTGSVWCQYKVSVVLEQGQCGVSTVSVWC
jgi:hypothetical protein